MITKQNFTVLSCTVCVQVGGPKNFEDAMALPFGMGEWLTPINMLLPNVCYHTKFRRARSNCVGLGRGAKNIGNTGAPIPWDEA